MWPILQFSADLVTFTEEIFNGKLHFLCSDPFDATTVFLWLFYYTIYFKLTDKNILKKSVLCNMQVL